MVFLDDLTEKVMLFLAVYGVSFSSVFAETANRCQEECSIHFLHFSLPPCM